AEVLRAIFLGELTAHEHSRKIRAEHATANFGDQMNALRERLQGGDDRERRETLRAIAQNSLTLIMDDSWLDAYEAAAADSEWRVRQEVARQVAGRWASGAPGAESVPAKAFALLL